MAKAAKDEAQYLQLEDKIDAALLEKRRIFISSPVDNNSATDLIKKLWYLEINNPGKPIEFIINSPGGSVSDGFAIWDQVKMISSPVTTIVTGMAASMGSILSLCADKGRRFATPNARVMIHQPRNMGMVQGQATDLDIYAKEMLKTRKRIVDIYVEHTGKDEKIIEKAIDRDRWFAADEAKEFGLLDGIVSSFKDLPK